MPPHACFFFTVKVITCDAIEAAHADMSSQSQSVQTTTSRVVLSTELYNYALGTSKGVSFLGRDPRMAQTMSYTAKTGVTSSMTATANDTYVLFKNHVDGMSSTIAACTSACKTAFEQFVTRNFVLFNGNSEVGLSQDDIEMGVLDFCASALNIQAEETTTRYLIMPVFPSTDRAVVGKDPLFTTLYTLVEEVVKLKTSRHVMFSEFLTAIEQRVLAYSDGEHAKKLAVYLALCRPWLYYKFMETFTRQDTQGGNATSFDASISHLVMRQFIYDILATTVTGISSDKLTRAQTLMTQLDNYVNNYPDSLVQNNYGNNYKKLQQESSQVHTKVRTVADLNTEFLRRRQYLHTLTQNLHTDTQYLRRTKWIFWGLLLVYLIAVAVIVALLMTNRTFMAYVAIGVSFALLLALAIGRIVLRVLGL